MSQTPSSDEEDDFKAVSSANYQRIQDKVTKINYADGIADGREDVFQLSFDQGYADGLSTGFELAKYKSFCDTLATSADKENNEVDLYKKLQLGKATDQKHFKYLEHQNESLHVVSDKQKAYLDNLLGQFSTELPETSSLFTSK
ncbi:uncharacterized protein Dwil_GK11141 [Drosophila willistoni]|uniref:Essential protein Yae1 N-terminal domain-containing protein n=1 Tax=Drosophila willistoni TaxID=7260 RepID=B4NBR0_DROWI|nr:putative tRNA 2'-phosphotransferase [Drosophila willistoni]EDW81224.1 uncharacterized protein Dwil_GK11141 [Drosophila willistoni]